jgi:hypothetical protein
MTKPNHDDGADSAWEGMTQGDLGREEEAFLRALAEESEDDAVRLEAHAPLDAGFRARMVDVLSDELRKKRRAKARRIALGTGSAVLVAAAAVLLMLRPDDSLSLPPYTLSASGHVQEVRGSVDTEIETLRVGPNTTLVLTAQPATRVEHGVYVRVMARAGSDAVPVASQVDLAESGAVRVTVRAADLPFPAAAELTLGIVLSPSLLSVDEAAERLRGEQDHVLRVSVVRDQK